MTTGVDTGGRLGPYEVVSRIGAGGMGEVFRARDTRLDRTVAIKVLPREFANDAQLKLRFEREAKSISQIAHPNICTLYDVGHADGVDYLVLEFLEGETLADRIGRGPIPLADVLRFGREISSALDRAHRAGIVHRDLKPGNIMITKSGAKLLDFGLARNASTAGKTTDATEHKPLTQEGTILGTFQYMSPEQLAGEEADERSDIFALGAVLYEMLTGTRAFEGKSRTSIIAAIVAGTPRPVSSIQPMTPPALEHVIARCLAKERDDRWQSAADIGSELEWIASGTSGQLPGPVVEQRTRRKAMLPFAAVTALLAIAAVTAGIYATRRVRAAEQTVRSELIAEGPLTPSMFGALTLSPDGTQLAMLVGTPAKPRISVRNLITGEVKRLDATDGAIFPFWSPDSQRLGFFAGAKLKTINIANGSLQTICDAPQGRGGAWNAEGIIVFAPDIDAPLYKVPESGGTPVAITKKEDGRTHRNPTFLPDGKTILFGGRGRIDAASIDGNLQKVILDNAAHPRYANGLLFFIRDGTAFSQRFDTRKLELSGSLTPVADHVEYYEVRDIASFSVTPSKIVYSNEAVPQTEIVVYDRAGRMTELTHSPADYQVLAASPDGRMVATKIEEHFEKGDIWMVDMATGARSRLTFTNSGALSAAFSPDAKRLAMSSGVLGRKITVAIRSLVSNEVEKIAEIPTVAIVTDWSRDGRYLVVATQERGTGFDVNALDLATKKMTPVVAGPADELTPSLSPNGKWLAYMSAESGVPQIYVTSFPSGEGKWQATQDGGTAPRWSPDGKELFFVKDRVMTIDFRDGTMPQFGSQTRLPVSVTTNPIIITSSGYAVTPDGRFVSTPAGGDLRPTIHLITNWESSIGR